MTSMSSGFRTISCTPCRERKVRCDRLVPCKSCIRRQCESLCLRRPARLVHAQRTKVRIERARQPATAYQRIPVYHPPPPASAMDAVAISVNPLASPRPAVGYGDCADVGVDHLPSGSLGQVYEPQPLGLQPSPPASHRSGSSLPYVPPLYRRQSLTSLHFYNSLDAFRSALPTDVSWPDSLNALLGAHTDGTPRPDRSPPSPAFGIELSEAECLQWQIYLASKLPSQNQCDVMLAYFFENVNWIYQIIHEPSFRDIYNRTWSSPIQDLDLIWLSLLFIALSLSSMYISAEVCDQIGLDGSAIRQMAHAWYQMSRQCLQAGSAESRPCLQQIQTFLLSQLYWYSTKKVEALNSGLGQAVRAAQAISLDKDQGSFNALETEMRHRIWWDLCSADVYQSLCLDRQPLIQAYLSNVPFPSNCNDCDISQTAIISHPAGVPTVMSAHIERARVFKALSRLYSMGTSPSYELVCGVDAEVQNIKSEFPWFFQLDPKLVFPPSLDSLPWQHHIIHSAIYIQRMRMYRPFLRSQHTLQAMSRCTEAAESAFAVYHLIRSQNPNLARSSQKLVSQSYQLFCGAISIAMFLLVERPNVAASALKEQLQIIFSDLQILASKECPVPMAVDGLSALSQIIEAYEESSTNSTKQDNLSVLHDIYTIMGGKTKTREYLDRCRVSFMVNEQPVSCGNEFHAQSPATLGTIMSSVPGTAINVMDLDPLDVDESLPVRRRVATALSCGFEGSLGAGEYDFDLFSDILSWDAGCASQPYV